MCEVFTVWFHEFRNVKGDKKRSNILMYFDPKALQSEKWTSSKYQKKNPPKIFSKKSEKPEFEKPCTYKTA